MKKRIDFLIVITFIITLFSLIGCNEKKGKEQLQEALKLAGENKGELQKVLDYYEAPEDALKLKAAKFLIANMPYHSYTERDYRFDIIFTRMARIKIDANDLSSRRSTFERKLHYHKKYLIEQDSVPTYKKINDIETIDSDYMINNIELAFEAWYRIPKEKRASFNEFCNYILPYRANNEPLEKGTRLKLYKRYSWVYKELNEGMTLKELVDKITADFCFYPATKMSASYPLPLSFDQMEKARLGLCDDGINYFVNLFRAIGIACSKDYVTHWGNHYSKGHSWFYSKLGDEEYSTNTGSGDDTKKVYKEESIPKVNRVSFKHQKESYFSIFTTDVTSTYVKNINLDIDNKFGVDVKTPVLCVFDGNKEWEVVTYGKYTWGKSKFLNMGIHVVYLPGSMEVDGTITPVNYPFYIGNNKQVYYFKPESTVLESVSLLRKYGLTTSRDRGKLNWTNLLNGAEVQVSNTKDFTTYKTIHKIQEFNSTQLQNIKVNTLNKYKFIRFKSNSIKETYLARLAFYDENKNKLEGRFFEENVSIRKDAAFNDDPLKFSGGTDFTIGMEFNEPKQISVIEFQARNDGNHIDKGDDYELFYWDKEWQSLGLTRANDTVLYYDVPANSLFWLKNHTKGKEEHVFTIDKNKKQQWLGFDNDF